MEGRPARRRHSFAGRKPRAWEQRGRLPRPIESLSASRVPRALLPWRRLSDAMPSVSVIVPTRPGQAMIPAVEAARELDYPKDRLEILVARGRQPAVQRN